VPNLPGRVRIPLNYNVIDISHQTHLDENRVYTYGMFTCAQVPLPAYFVRKLVLDIELSQELMCPTYLNA